MPHRSSLRWPAWLRRERLGKRQPAPPRVRSDETPFPGHPTTPSPLEMGLKLLPMYALPKDSSLSAHRRPRFTRHSEPSVVTLDRHHPFYQPTWPGVYCHTTKSVCMAQHSSDEMDLKGCYACEKLGNAEERAKGLHFKFAQFQAFRRRYRQQRMSRVAPILWQSFGAASPTRLDARRPQKIARKVA